MPDGTGMFSRQIPAYAGLTSGQIPGVWPGGGIIAVGIDSYISTTPSRVQCNDNSTRSYENQSVVFCT